MEDEISRAPSTSRRRPTRRKVAAPRSTQERTLGAGAGISDSKVSGTAEQPASRQSRMESQTGSRDEVGMESDEHALEELLASAGSVRDLERLASDNPRTAVIGALAAGFLIGFGVGLLAAKD